MEKTEIQTKGKYNITYKNIEYSFEGGNTYTVDTETADMLIKNGYATYIETEKSGKNSGKKTANNKQ